MTTRLHLQHYTDWLLPGSLNDTRLPHADESDLIRVCPPQLGQGYRQDIPLRDDLSLVILDYTLNQDLVFDASGAENSLELTFHLASKTPGYSFFCPEFGWRGLGIIPKRQHVFKVELFFKQSALATYYQKILERLAPRIYEMFEYMVQSSCHGQSYGSKTTMAEMFTQLQQASFSVGRHLPALSPALMNQFKHEAIELRYAFRSLITPAMEQVISKILNCPYQGKTRRTYLERQALKLIGLRLNAMAQPSLNEVDADCIYEAAQILRRQCAQPPNIETLARQVGTNRLKLNQGFHEVYGTTPFSYLRDCRISKAQQLMATSELSINEVANAVGYTCRSKFATAFRQQAGINPKPYQMTLWQLISQVRPVA